EVVAVAGEKEVVKYVHFELIKLASLLSVGANLTDTQASFIAEELIRVFPNETLADFKLCFQRGAIGQYNINGEKDIFRMDGIVLRRWMEKYLEEKYQVVEEKLMKEKDEYYRITADPKQTEDVADKYIVQMLDALKPNKTASGITDEEIRQEGQERPKRKPYPSTPASLIRQCELHDQWIRECFDIYTGKPNENWMPEDEWLKINDK